MHSTITGRGQTTIPRNVREALNLKPGDVITYEIEGKSAIIKPAASILTLMGSMRYENMPVETNLGKIREQSISQWAAHAAKEGL